MAIKDADPLVAAKFADERGTNPRLVPSTSRYGSTISRRCAALQRAVDWPESEIVRVKADRRYDNPQSVKTSYCDPTLTCEDEREGYVLIAEYQRLGARFCACRELATLASNCPPRDCSCGA